MPSVDLDEEAMWENCVGGTPRCLSVSLTRVGEDETKQNVEETYGSKL